jgi:hypothetical protein
MEEKKKKEPKVFKQVTNEALKSVVDKVVDELYKQGASKDLVNEVLKEFKNDYGVKATLIRKVAQVVYKRNKQDVEQENEQLMELLSKVGE